MAGAKPDEKSIFNAARRIESPEARRRYLAAGVRRGPRPARPGRGPAPRPRRGRHLPPARRRTGSTAASATRPARPPGAVVGPYTLLRQLGEGGMGVVFLAEQAQPVRRQVALKIIRPGMDSRQVLARFEAERQALALMDHPNIAKVLDAGATPAGRPYFVMELVQGVPITDVLRRAPADAPPAAGAVRAGLPGGPARPPEGGHPPRPQAVQRPGRGATTASRCPRSSTSAWRRRPGGG